MTAQSAAKELTFFFDFSSPFAYLGATQVEDVAARTGAVVRYRPFLLGGLFRDIGTPNVPLFEATEPKRQNYLADMARWADHWGVPLRFPTRFPMNTIKPLRMIIALPEDERRRLVVPIFSAYWASDRDIADDATLRDVADAAGFNGAELLEKTKEEAVKGALKQAGDEARSLGICGAPSFLVNGLLFWGQDRLLFVEKALNGWVPKGEVGA